MPAERPIRPFCGCYLQDCKQLVNAIIVWSIIFKTPDSVLKKPNPNACICTVWKKWQNFREIFLYSSTLWKNYYILLSTTYIDVD